MQKSLTMDRLKDLHGSLSTCPSDNVFADDPKALRVDLMNHQKHALAWLMWRESQKPSGGILGKIILFLKYKNMSLYFF